MSRLADAGVALPRLGLGTAAIGGLHGPVSHDDAAAALGAAWRAGIRFYDTAPLYGRGLGETRTGALLRPQPRDAFVLSSKVGWRIRPDGTLALDYSRTGTIRSVEESLGRLGVDHLDIALVHDIDPYNHRDNYPARLREVLADALPALAELKRNGRIRAFGIGVNDPEVCLQVLADADLDCILLAGRYTLLDASAAAALFPECLRRATDVIVGAPFNTGLLAKGSRSTGRYHHDAPSEAILRRVRALEGACERHGVPLAAAALHFPVRHPAVAAVLPGPRSARQVEEVAAAATLAVPDALWDDLGAIVGPTMGRSREECA